MMIDRFEVPGLAQYSYIVSSQGQGIIVDPSRDTDRYLHFLEKRGLALSVIVETHIHADFASGAKALAEATGAELALSGYDQGEHYRYGMPHRSLRNGDILKVGAVRLEALHTPGHTPEHLSFVAYDTQRSETEPLAIFSGDFLFVGSVGRPDLLGEEAKRGLAHELFQSLHLRLEALPDSVQVYPGHGAGSLCGAGMSERAESTLGY
ncbi:MAG: MBL fold metallo-hydrolase, partial [Acidobacteria bacterium]|nr:MBL fold metallo-hydrolase [Acidobacteriota bacterium]